MQVWWYPKASNFSDIFNLIRCCCIRYFHLSEWFPFLPSTTECIASVNLIVVGCGKWGANLIGNALSSNRLVATVDSSESSISAINRKFPALKNIPSYTALGKALKSQKDAAVVIATPPATHFAIGMEALKANRHVFIEKPLCDALSDALQLVAEAEKRRRVLMVDHLLQYSLAHRHMIDLVASGYVANVIRVRMCRLNFGTIRTAEDVLWSFCPHDFSILLAIMRARRGDGVYAKTVSCLGQAIVSSDITDYVDVCITFSDGSRAHVEASWLHPTKERRVVVYGMGGSLILNEAVSDKSLPKLQAFKWSVKRRTDGSLVDIEKSEDDVSQCLDLYDESGANEFCSDTQPLRAALDHFAHCITKNIIPRTDGKEGLRVLALLDAATRSLCSGGIAIPVFQTTSSLDIDRIPASSETRNGNGIPFVHKTAVVDNGASIGDGTKVWHFSHVMSGAVVGSRCNIGQNVFIGGDAKLGNNVKVQNNVSIYDAVSIDDDVFLGPSCVLTNVKNPRSHLSRKHMFEATILCRGVTIGANATIVCGVTLGQYCFVGAGAVVTKNVPAHALMYGNPACVHGWVSTTGIKLKHDGVTSEGATQLRCPESNEVYILHKQNDNDIIRRKKTDESSHHGTLVGPL